MLSYECISNAKQRDLTAKLAGYDYQWLDESFFVSLRIIFGGQGGQGLACSRALAVLAAGEAEHFAEGMVENVIQELLRRGKLAAPIQSTFGTLDEVLVIAAGVWNLLIVGSLGSAEHGHEHVVRAFMQFGASLVDALYAVEVLFVLRASGVAKHVVLVLDGLKHQRDDTSRQTF